MLEVEEIDTGMNTKIGMRHTTKPCLPRFLRACRMRCRTCSISAHQFLGGVTHHPCSSDDSMRLEVDCCESYPFEAQRDHQKEEEHDGNDIRGSLKKRCATVRSHDSCNGSQQQSLNSPQLSTVVRKCMRISADADARARLGTRNLPLQRTHRGIRCKKQATAGRRLQREIKSYRELHMAAVRGSSKAFLRQHCRPVVELHASRQTSAACVSSPADAIKASN